MQPTSAATARHSPSGTRPPSVGESLGTFLGFLLIVSAALLAITYPFAVLTVLLGTAAVVVIGRRLVRGFVRHQGTIRRVDVPGLGTVEYRVVRS